jgi:hypothetical protein
MGIEDDEKLEQERDIAIYHDRELSGPDKAHRILLENNTEGNDRPDNALQKVPEATYKVNHLLGLRGIIEGVDGEIAPPHILPYGAETVVVASHSVGCTECGDLVYSAPHDNMNQQKTAADDTGIAEKLLYLAWVCVGDNVKILGLAANNHIPDSTAHNVGLVPCVPEPVADKEGVMVNLLFADIMFVLLVELGQLYSFAPGVLVISDYHII